MIEKHAEFINLHFTCQLVKIPMENPLFAATDAVNEVLESLSDMCSNRFGNDNFMATPGGLFYKLTRRICASDEEDSISGSDSESSQGSSVMSLKQ